MSNVPTYPRYSRRFNAYLASPIPQTMGQWDVVIAGVTTAITTIGNLVAGSIAADKQAKADDSARHDALAAQQEQHRQEEELARIAVEVEREERYKAAAEQRTLTRLITIGGGVLLVGLGVMYLMKGDEAVTKKVE
jgi:hypothetical protein